MEWYVSLDSDITPSPRHLAARHDFIYEMTGKEVSIWERMAIKSVTNNNIWYHFKRCTTNDDINGAFITAHNYELFAMCKNLCFENCEMVVANTCKYLNDTDSRILSELKTYNDKVELWFAQQEIAVLQEHKIRYKNELHNVGAFGFATSKSERTMFRNRHKGLKKAIESSFYEVHPTL